MSATIPALPAIGHSILVLDEVDSTNNYAMQTLKQGLAQHGQVYFAQKQTQGKGQHGKQWITEPGSNIIMSVVVATNHLNAQQPFLLSMAVAVACAAFLTHFTNGNICIKWPNDLYWNDRKAGGILIENQITANYSGGSQWNYSVIGIGININQSQFAPELANAVSLLQITGKTHPPVLLCKELCGYLQKEFLNLGLGNTTDLIKAYNSLLYKRTEWVTLVQQNRKFTTEIIGVNTYGQLLTNNGVLEENFTHGEVSWLLS